MKKVLSLLLAMIVLLAVPALAETTTDEAIKPSKVILDQSGTVTLNLGEELQLGWRFEPAEAQSNLKWSTSSERIATVKDGVVTPIKEGTVTITVITKNGKKDSVKVKVVDPYKPTGIVLNEDKVTVNVGETLQLTTTLKPETAQTKLKWKTSKKSVATVSADGLLTAIKEGAVTITVTTANGKKDTAKIKVVDPYQPAKVEIDGDAVRTLNFGETLQLTTTLLPETAKSDLTWKSSSTKIVKVTDGLLIPVKEGTAKITVTTRNGKKDTVTVKVVDPYKPTSIQVAERSAAMVVGEKRVMQATLLPETAQSTLTWTSSNKKIATVSADGEVTALREGKVKITVKANKGGKTATIYLTITDPNKISSIKIDKTGTQFLKVGNKIQIYYKVFPETAQTTLTWKSSNTGVATVSEDGLVTAVGTGTATITVTTHNGKQASVKISVSEPEIANPVGAKELSGYMGKPFASLKQAVSGLFSGEGKYEVMEFFKSGAENEFWGFLSTGDKDGYTGGWKKDYVYAIQTKLQGYALHGFYVGMPESDVSDQAEKMGYANVSASGDTYVTYNLSGKKVGDVNYSMMVFAKSGQVYAVRLYALKDGFYAP